jgi:hypothetical protein
MRPGFVLVTAYILVLAVAGAVFFLRDDLFTRDPPAAGLVAGRALAPGSLVLPGDLRPAGRPDPTALDGRYLAPGEPIAAGAAAPPARFVAAPDLWPAPRHLLLALPLPEGMDPRLADAGGTARLCHADLPAPVALPIRALRCAAAACTAVLELAPAQAAQAAPALAAPQGASICPR